MVLILRKPAATYHPREVRVENPKNKLSSCSLATHELECGVPYWYYYLSCLLVYAVPQVGQPYFMVLMSWRCLSHVYRDVLRLAPQAALPVPTRHMQSDTVDVSITLALRARRCSISSRFAATRRERLGGWDHLTWISCWIASQGHRSALWPNVVPSQTGPTDLETARRLVPTLVHGLGAQSCQGSGGSRWPDTWPCAVSSRMVFVLRYRV
jgi:hypothetical protein